MEYYSVMIRKGSVSFATAWMKPDSISLSEISHTEKDTYHKISLTEGM